MGGVAGKKQDTDVHRRLETLWTCSIKAASITPLFLLDFLGGGGNGGSAPSSDEPEFITPPSQRLAEGLWVSYTCLVEKLTRTLQHNRMD